MEETHSSVKPRTRLANSVLGFILAAALSACTTVGMHTRQRSAVEYGPPIQLRVCMLRAEDVSLERMDELIAAVNEEFAPYAIEVVVPWVRPWTRSGFTVYGIFDSLARLDLEPPCDRLVALVDRNVADFLWGLARLPEVLGAVDEDTHTHGYVVATVATEVQLGAPPDDATVHEFYHLLGCPHALALTGCYRRIADLKRHILPSADFVPGVTQGGDFLATREAANVALRAAVAKDDAKRRTKPSRAVALKP